MNSVRVVLIALVAYGLGGCASNVPVVDFYKASSDTLRQYRHVDVLTDASGTSPGLVDLGEVEGIYCKKQHRDADVGDPEAELQAIDQVRLKAADLGADTIAAPSCESQTSSDFSNNCYGTLVCRTTVYRRAE